MAQINTVPDKLINFKVYSEGNDVIGVADAELPAIEYMTEGLSGAGILGEIEAPAFGQMKSLAVKLKFRTITKDGVGLLAAKTHKLDLRGSIQAYDAADAEFKPYAAKLVVHGLTKKSGLGKFEVGKPGDSEVELECTYLKLSVGDQDEALEIDKLNFVFKVNGEDQMAEVRGHLGIGE